MAFDFPDSSSLPDGYRVTNTETFSEYAWQADPGKWVLVDPVPMSDLFVDKTGDTMSGPLFLTDDPVIGDPGVIGSDPAQAVHKDYVDKAVSAGGALPLVLDTSGLGADAPALYFTSDYGHRNQIVIGHAGGASTGTDIVFDPPSYETALRVRGGSRNQDLMVELVGDNTIRFHRPTRCIDNNGNPRMPQHEDDFTVKAYVDTVTRSIVTGLRTAVDNATTFEELKVTLMEALNELAGDTDSSSY